jgi:hypothetical protein
LITSPRIRPCQGASKTQLCPTRPETLFLEVKSEKMAPAMIAGIIYHVWSWEESLEKHIQS